MDTLQNILTDALTAVSHFAKHNGLFTRFIHEPVCVDLKYPTVSQEHQTVLKEARDRLDAESDR